jgi:RNA polymerase sigma-70 factor (ECF subfamily)
MDKAFDILAEQFRPMLQAYARTLTDGDEHVAEDLVQETLLAAHGSLDTFRKGENFGKWLRGILRNRALGSRRTALRRPLIVDSRIVEGMEEVYTLLDPPHADAVEWRERLELMRDCIGRLSEPLRLAVLEVYAQGLSLKQAAERLSASSLTVGKRLSRARDLIRECVQKRMGEQA